MSLPDFGTFTVHIDESLEVGGGDNCGFSARRSGNPVFKCKSLKEVEFSVYWHR